MRPPGLWTAGAHMQKERQALPSAARFRINRMLGNARFAQRLNEESRLFQRQKVGRDRTVLAVECHCQTVPLDCVGVAERAKVVAFDGEGRVGVPAFEMSSRVDGMDNRET